MTPEIAAAVMRMASAGTMTPRGIIMRLPFPRQDATLTVLGMLDNGALMLRDDGTVGPPSNSNRKRTRRVNRDRLLMELRKRPQSARMLADVFRSTPRAVQQHLTRMFAAGEISVVGYDKRPNVRGYACRVYAIAEARHDA